MFRKGEKLRVIRPTHGDSYMPALNKGDIVTVIENNKKIVRVITPNGRKFGYYKDRFEHITKTNYSEIKQQLLEM